MSWHDFYVVRGRALGVHQGGGTHVTGLATVCGGGVQEGTMAVAMLSASFQSLPPLPTSKVGPSGADSQVSGFVYILSLIHI